MSHSELVVTLSGASAGQPATGVCDIPGVDLHPACLGGDAVGGLVGGIAGGAIQELAEAVVGAVTEVLEAVVGFLAAPIRPDVQQNWLAASVDRMLAASATFALLFFVFGIARAILRSSPRELGRVVGYTVAAFAGSGVALALTQAFIVLVDVASAQVAAGTGRDMAHTFDAMVKPLTALLVTGPGGSLLAALLGGLVGLAALAVYLELFVRNVMIHVVVYFLPLMLIGTIWGPTRRWGKRGIEFLGVLILSKFVLYAVISLGWSAVASFDDTALSTAWASVLTGFVLIAVAAWMPWLLFKLLPFMEVHVRAAMNRHDARGSLTAPLTSAGAPMRTLESNLRRAAGVAALVKGGPMAAALVTGGGRGAGFGGFLTSAGGARMLGGAGGGGARGGATEAVSAGRSGTAPQLDRPRPAGDPQPLPTTATRSLPPSSRGGPREGPRR